MITVGDIIAEHRRSYPGRLALADGEVHLTWPELDERVNRLANALRGTGVGPGDPHLVARPETPSGSTSYSARRPRSGRWCAPATGAGPRRR